MRELVLDETEDEEFKRKFFDIKKKSIFWLKDWANKRIDGKNFKETVTYEDISLWWFADTWMNFISRRPFYSIWEVMKGVELVKYKLEKEKPDKVVIKDGKTLIGRIAFSICRQKNIPVEVRSNFKSNLNSFFISNFIPIGTRFFTSSKEKMRELAWKFQKRQRKEKRRKKVLFLTFTTNIQTTIDPLTKESKKKDLRIYSIVKELKKKKFDVTLIEMDISDKIGLSFLKWDEDTIPVEAFLTKEIKRKIKEQKKRLKKVWKELEGNEKFKNSMVYDGVSIWEFAESNLKEIFYRKFVEGIKYVELMEKIFEIEKPDIFISTDEGSVYSRASYAAAKIVGIPSLNIQNGYIGEYHAARTHLPDEIGGDLTPSHCPIPDVSAVYGEFDRKNLIDIGHYSPKKVVVTGDPRYDMIKNIDKILKKEDVFEKLNLDPKKKTIVVATQPWSRQESELIINSVFNAMKNIPEAQLIVKPHRFDIYSSLYEKLAKENGVDATIIKDIDIFELLYICDILIAKYSSVALEAVAFDKPVISINLTGMDSVPYTREGIVVGVDEAEDVALAIKNIFENKKVGEELREKRKEFVSYYAHKIDGKSMERILNLIKKLAG